MMGGAAAHAGGVAAKRRLYARKKKRSRKRQTPAEPFCLSEGLPPPTTLGELYDDSTLPRRVSGLSGLESETLARCLIHSSCSPSNSSSSISLRRSSSFSRRVASQSNIRYFTSS